MSGPNQTLQADSLPPEQSDTMTLEADRDGDASIPAGPLDSNHLPALDARFELVKFLGRGGMGDVYLARDRELDRPVAVKRIATESGAGIDLVCEEARLTARIEHSNVVKVYDVKQTDAGIYIISEYIDGRSLDRLEPPIPWRRAARLGRDLARGLAAAHAGNVLHRDIKPSNAIWDRKAECAKLIDFGVARLAGSRAADRQGTVATAASKNPPAPTRGRAGTPLYQAPEIWDRGAATTRSDVYSFGALLYELCTGDKPPSMEDPESRRPIVLQRDDIDIRFRTIVNRCLAIEPGDRYDSAVELAGALEALHGAPDDPDNPYRGLFGFHEQHRVFFFGREADAARFIEHLRSHRAVVMFGRSGVGKSSLARAGILPRIAEGALGGGRQWTYATAVPGTAPLMAICRQLATIAGVEPESFWASAQRGDLESIGRELATHLGARRGAVLFVDQIEELITLSGKDQAQGAEKLLTTLIAGGPDSLRILLAVRGDYLTELAELPELGPMIQGRMHIVPPLERAGILAAIVEPARKMGVHFESSELVDELLNAALEARGGLPLLQFALAELWNRRDAGNGAITGQALADLGGVAGALARHADHVLSELSDGKQRDVARRMLVKLVTLRRTRARCTRDELCAGSPLRSDVLEHLVTRRLLVCHESDGDWVYSIAHEALFTAWPQLRDWLDRERDQREVMERLANAAQEWHRLGRSRDLLWGEKQLAAARCIDRDDLSEVEAAFLAASEWALFRTRWLRRGVVIAILAILVGVYGAVRYQAYRHLQAKVAVARDKLDVARAAHGRLSLARERAVHALQDRRPRWRQAWRDALAEYSAVVAGYREASLAVEAAFDVDPNDDTTRQLMAAVLQGRAQFADMAGKSAERDDLIARLQAIDPATAETFYRPEGVTIAVEPADLPGTSGPGLEIQRLSPEWPGEAAAETKIVIAATPARVSLVPGSYMLVVPATEDRLAVRYPFLVRHNKKGERAEAITIYRPRASTVPDGFVYIPEGWFYYGHGRTPDDEEFRQWYEALPLHRRYSGAYLIARHETTYRQWIEFLDACARKRCPGIGSPSAGIELDIEGMRLELGFDGDRGWELLWQRRGDDEYRAVAGEHLVYQKRQRNRSQDWRQFPVTGVSWKDVRLYLQWLREVKGIAGADLCTEEQWERGARGADDRRFPHGDTLSVRDANFDKTYSGDTGSRRASSARYGPDQVGLHPRSVSPFGLHDMAGNAGEMTRLVPDAPSPGRRPSRYVPDVDTLALRGGSFFHRSADSGVINSWVITAEQTLPYAGFRVCAAAPVE